MLLGTFMSQVDWTFVLASYSTVASEFNDLSSGSWMLSVYILAQCAVQPLYGKLSDIYGRKSCLQASYVFFTIGTAGCGLAWSMAAVIAFRTIQGAGGAGMVSMVSIIITDLVPMHEVASLRSYVNVLQTVGRSAGGVIGGLLTQTIGWRWAFLCQVPFMIVAMLLVQWRLEVPIKYGPREQSKQEKLKRVDFFGAFSLCLAILGLCFVLEVGGQKVKWDSPIIFAFVGVSVLAGTAFVFNASRVPEPIFPLRLLTHFDVVTYYVITLLQVILQMSLTLTVPLYWQATTLASPGETGLYLIPAFAGNTLGGLFSGYWIKHTGRFKLPTVLGPIAGICCMVLCLLTWNGHGGAWKSIFIFPGGLGMGIISSSVFVGLAASVPEEDVAIAGSGMYLCVNIGGVAGTAAGSAVYEAALRRGLQSALMGQANGGNVRVNDKLACSLIKRTRLTEFLQIAQRLLEDMAYLSSLPNSVWQRVIPAYVDAFHATNGRCESVGRRDRTIADFAAVLGLVCTGVSLLIAVSTRGKRLLR